MSRVVNVSGDQRKAAATLSSDGFEPLPAGWYDAVIFSIEEKEFRVKGKHAGDTYLNVDLKVSRGDFANRRVFAMVPLFPAWTPKDKDSEGFPTLLVPFLEGLGIEAEGEIEIPSDEDLLGTEITFRVNVEVDTYRLNQGIEDGTIKEEDIDEGKVQPPRRNNVRTFRPYDEDNDPSPTYDTPATAPAARKPAARKATPKASGGTLDL